MKKEAQQLHDLMNMQVKRPSDLTPGQKNEALAYLMLLKRKCGRKIKDMDVQMVANSVHPQPRRMYALPLVATDAACLAAVMEECEVAVFDVPGAFMLAEMVESVPIRFTGKTVENFLVIDREMYKPCIMMEWGKK